MNSRIVLDGNFLSMRNFFAMGKEAQDEKKLTISILQTIYKIIKEDDYQSQIIVAWDGGHSRYRPASEFTEYKATREYDKSYDVLWRTLNNLHDNILNHLGVCTLKFTGVEADDIGYYYSYLAKRDSIPTTLYSVDRDWLISVNEYCKVCRPHTKDPIWTLDQLKESYKLEDNSFLLYKAILGDGSDNISGITSSNALILQYCREYRSGLINEDHKRIIDRNLDMMRLDRIVTDEEVTKSLDEQAKQVYYSYGSMIAHLRTTIGEFPGYFYGVGKKYLANRNMDRIKKALGK